MTGGKAYQKESSIIHNKM